MAKAKCKAYVCRNIDVAKMCEKVSGMSYKEMQKYKDYSANYFAFTTVMYNPNDGLIYCGTTAFDSDILWTFDPKAKKFESLNYPLAEGAENFDVKVHRSLCLDDDGMIYGSTAELHDVDLHQEAKGGKVFSYNPKTKQIKILAIPVPHQYPQNLAIDKKRKILYGFTYPVAHIFRYDIKTGKAIDLGFTNQQPHIPAVDDDGNCWGQWGLGNTGNLLSYHPDTGMKFHKYGFGKFSDNDMGIDGMINGGDGYIYIGTTGGALYRLDPKKVELKYLGHPCPSNRLAGIDIAPNGLIYGAGGSNFKTNVFVYDREKEKFYDLGPLYDPEINDSCFIPHHATVMDNNTLYTGDTDNPKRSGFLWECKIEL